MTDTPKITIAGITTTEDHGARIDIEFDEGEHVPLNPNVKAIFVHEQSGTIVGDSDEDNLNILLKQAKTTSELSGVPVSIFVKAL